MSKPVCFEEVLSDECVEVLLLVVVLETRLIPIFVEHRRAAEKNLVEDATYGSLTWRVIATTYASKE
jgi:hypothetical protein